MIGDSHASVLLHNLNEEIKNKNLSLFRFEPFMYLKDFNRVNRETNSIGKLSVEEIDDFLTKNSI